MFMAIDFNKSWNVVKIFIKLCSFFILFFIIAQDCVGSQSEKTVELNIIPDKTRYKIGDEFNLKYIITNTGDSDIRIFRISDNFAAHWIRINDSKKNYLRIIRKVIYDIKIIPDESDFVLIKSNDSFCVTLTGKIAENKIKLETQNKHISGLFLEFNTAAFQLNGPGKYSIKGKYVGLEEWRKQGLERFNFTNVWSGRIESEEVEIELTE